MNELNGLSQEAEQSLWKQHGVVVDLYKFFFDWVLKLVIFYYTITGAILGFCLSRPSEGLLRFSLLLPFLLGLFLFWLFALGRRGLGKTQREVHDIENLLKPKMKLDIRFLPKFLVVNAVMCLVTAIALLILLTLMFVLPLGKGKAVEVQRIALSGDCEIITTEASKAPNPGPAPDKQRVTRIVCR